MQTLPHMNKVCLLCSHQDHGKVPDKTSHREHGEVRDRTSHREHGEVRDRTSHQDHGKVPDKTSHLSVCTHSDPAVRNGVRTPSTKTTLRPIRLWADTGKMTVSTQFKSQS